jgi:putative flippase GtrA
MIQILLAANKRHKIVRFIIVGGLNTLFGYGVYAGLILLGLHYAWAALLGIILGVIFNFFTTGGLVFKVIQISRLPKFVTVYTFSYGLNVALLSLLISVGTSELIAGLLILAPMALVNLVILRIWVFSE